MTRQERLQQIARELYDAKGIERDAGNVTKELRDEFFRLHDEEFKGKDHLLPVRTIEVPDVFFAATGMSKEDFIESRFPGWNVEHVEYNTALKKSVFILKRDKRFIPGVVEVDDGDKLLRVSKEVSEYTPEFDWDTLKAERPDLFEKITTERVVQDLDGEKLQEALADDPEIHSILMRHTKYTREPQQRVGIKDA